MEKLGVVVIAYNAEAYIKTCIESLIHQTYSCLEIVIVNDGSTDQTEEICQSYAKQDSRIRVITQENQGMIQARYCGVKAIEASYVTFVDSDDWLKRTALEEVMSYGYLGQADVISFGVVCYYGESDQYQVHDHYGEGIYHKGQMEETIFPTLLWDVKNERHGVYPSLCAKIFRKELFLKNIEPLKDYHFNYAEDSAVIYPTIAESRAIAIIHKSLYIYRRPVRTRVPAYISDKAYLDKLGLFYQYMRKRFEGKPYESLFIPQLDYFFIHSAKYRKWIYSDNKDCDKFLFPFDRVPKDSQIILYGCGSVGQTFAFQIKKINFCRIAAWVDQNYLEYSHLPVDSPEVIDRFTYDYLVIAVLAREVADVIEASLLKRGVDSKKIIKYFSDEAESW